MFGVCVCVFVCVVCVVCWLVCGVCWCVLRHGEKRGKKPCVDSNVPVYASTMCFQHVARGAGTHGDVLNVHTVKF